MNEKKTWPYQSNVSNFKSLPNPIRTLHIKRPKFPPTTPFPSSTQPNSRDFSTLPSDLILKIAATFTLPNLQSASLVCKSWSHALKPLREAMVFLRWGKRYKHGRGGLKASREKALDSFLKGAARGSTLCMVDGGLMYWEMGMREKAVGLYLKAAEIGDCNGQCNLAISYLLDEPSRATEAIMWLVKASVGGHVRAQYQLALCYHKGHGVDRNLQEAARWYLEAAGGGYVRAMYNVALCYSLGEGFVRSLQRAKKWMKRAADRGHSKAQYEHGVTLFTEGEKLKAVVYLELATRAGERAAVHVKNVILEQLSATSRDRIMFLADNWRASTSLR